MKNEAKKWKNILRLALAEQAFLEAKAMTDSLLKECPDPGSHLYNSCIAGLAISYARPFTSSQGLGSLPAEFEKFSGIKNEINIESIHKDLIILRNKIAAHVDLPYANVAFQKGQYKLNPNEIKIQLTLAGVIVETNHTTLPKHRLAITAELFAIQGERTSEKIAEFGVELLKRDKKLGSYIFKVNN